MDRIIRIVQNETFNREVADKIRQYEPDKIIQVSTDEYAFEKYLKFDKLPDGTYNCTFIPYPYDEDPYVTNVRHTIIYPKKVVTFIFDDAGNLKDKQFSFIGFDGKEVPVNKEYHSFKIGYYTNYLYEFSIAPSEDNKTTRLKDGIKKEYKLPCLDLFLHSYKIPFTWETKFSGEEEKEEGEEVDLFKKTIPIKNYVFAAFINNYTKEDVDIFDNKAEIKATALFSREQIMECFADDEFYSAVVNEERRRWVEIVAPKKKANPNLDVQSLKETKRYLRIKQTLADLREKSLKFSSGI